MSDKLRQRVALVSGGSTGAGAVTARRAAGARGAGSQTWSKRP
jgi:hypothetical protein